VTTELLPGAESLRTELARVDSVGTEGRSVIPGRGLGRILISLSLSDREALFDDSVFIWSSFVNPSAVKDFLSILQPVDLTEDMLSHSWNRSLFFGSFVSWAS